ncbi:pectin esterase [Paenibacillus hamazuiensis]|uniref:pectin esterase n=1 Tax=Paenibacillus hamazuiensis TaxID=2936508 RepID=UPI00200BAC71|nr:pectin esterase [Paenibacillus hamazuiensis]
MRIEIQRVLIFALLLNALLGGGIWLQNEPAFAAESAGTVFIDDDFTQMDDGMTAESLGYSFTAPASGTGAAAVMVDPNGGGKGMYVGVAGAGTGTAKIAKTFASPQKGTVTAEFSFMQPGPKKVQNVMFSLISSQNIPVVRIGTDSSTSRGLVYFPNTAIQGITSSYNVDAWYTIKVEVNMVTQQFNVWVNGALSASRAMADSNLDISRIEIGTPKGDGGEYIGKLKVSAAEPSLIPKAPDIYSWVPRDQEIGLWFESVTAASYYYVKTRATAEDPWYLLKYTGKNVPTERSSAKNYYVGTTAPRIVNGQTYDVGVSAVLKDSRTGLYHEGPTTIIQAAPNANVPVATPENSVIGTITLWASYYSANWSVKSGIHAGDAPFASSTYRITGLPAKYSQMDWISPDIRSQSYSDKPQIATFPAKDRATVYVAMDDRAALPAWLSSWTDTQDKIILDGGAVALKVYKQDFAPGATVTLGLNTAAPAGSGNIGYFVLAERTPVGLSVNPVNPWVNTPELTVTGSVYETGATLTVYNNQSPIYSSVLAESAFRVPVPLTPGENRLELTAKRANAALSDRIAVTVYYDAAPPELTIAAPPASVREAVYAIQGTVNENANITVKLNGVTVADSVYAAGGVPFSYPLTLAEGANHIEINAVDAAGNASSAELDVTYTFWAGEPEFYDLNGQRLGTLPSSGDVVARKQVANTTAAHKQISVFFVLFDGDHTMIDYSCVATDFAPGETRTLSTGFTLPAAGSGYKLKAFVWDNLGGMKPLSEEAGLP